MTRAMGALLGASLALSLLCLNPTHAAPPLNVFPGQWTTYRWECVGNSSGWFPGRDDYLRLSAICTYFILAVSDKHEASVRMQGTVEWAPDSVNRSLRLLTVQSNGSMTWEPLGEETTFDYTHSTTVSQDDGKVLSMSGPIALYASYTFPGGPYNVSHSFSQDQPQALSVYFFGAVDAAVGTNVSAWTGGAAQVLSHGHLETPMGSRPAILVSHNDSWFLPPLWVSAEQLTLQYDRETGFLLEVRHSIESSVNVTRNTHWSVAGDILATNMYGLRPEILLAQVILVSTCLGALVLMMLVSRSIIRGLEPDKATRRASEAPSEGA